MTYFTKCNVWFQKLSIPPTTEGIGNSRGVGGGGGGVKVPRNSGEEEGF